jgi:hypothetical protein
MRRLDRGTGRIHAYSVRYFNVSGLLGRWARLVQNVSFILIVQCFFSSGDCAETHSAGADSRES